MMKELEEKSRSLGYEEPYWDEDLYKDREKNRTSTAPLFLIYPRAAANPSYGLEIEKFDSTSRTLHYRLFLNREELLGVDVYDKFGVRLETYPNMRRTTMELQYLIETEFLRFCDPLLSEDSTVRIRTMPYAQKYTFLTAEFPRWLTLFLILSLLFPIRNMIEEKQTIQPYLRVMGVNRVDFYLSHGIITFTKIFVLSCVLSVLYMLFFPDFPWTVYIFGLVLYTSGMVSVISAVSAVFKSPGAATQVTVILVLVLEKLSVPARDTPTSLACLYAVWPSFSLYFVQNHCFAVMQFPDRIGNWSGLVDSQWTGHVVACSMLMPLVLSALCWGVIVVCENGSVIRRMCRNLSRRGSADDSTSPELIDDVNEAFDSHDAPADLVVSDVVKQYPTGEMAVKGISLEALRGQVTVLLGPNGAGKTTTFAMISGIELPTDGTVQICGAEAGSSEARCNIGYCAQTNTLMDKMTVKDHLWLAFKLKKAPGNYCEEGQLLLSKVGLLEHVDKKASKLSGGQKRKLCVCMALIGASRVVLLDEPTAGMDPESRRDVEKLLKEVKKERTVLLTTHYMDEADALGDRIFIMANQPSPTSGAVAPPQPSHVPVEATMGWDSPD